MANSLMRITPAGAVFSSLDGAKEVFDTEVVNAFGGDIDTHSHTPQEQFSSISASVWAEMTEELARAISYGTDLDTAPGKFLDAMGALLNIRRREATKTRVICQSTGLAGLVIPKGSIVQDAAGNRYASDQDVSIPSSGVANIHFTALKYGPIEVPQGSVIKIVSVLNGWDTITNEEAGVPGTHRETDTEYRANIKARTAKNASASKSAMESAISAAGSSKFRVIENASNNSTSIGSVSIPPHSIVVAASGGLSDDLSRAVNNSRGMGVNIRSAIEGTSDYSKSMVANMNAARFIFNGQTFKDINLSAQATTEAIATALNAYPSKPATYPDFTSSGTSLVAFYDWNEETPGFSDVDGQISPSIPVDIGFHVQSALIYGTKVRVKMTDTIASAGTGTNIARVSYIASGASTRTTITASASTIFGDMLIITLPSAVPSNATSPQVELTNTDGTTRNVKSFKGLYAPTAVALTDVEFTSDSAPPSNISTWVAPRSNGCQLFADVFSPVSITKWQYRRFDGVEIVAGDANWVDISASNTETIGQTLSGLSNTRKGARIELRAVVSDDQRVFGTTDTFNPSNTKPLVDADESDIDGESVILTTNIGLRARDYETTSAWTITLSGGGSRTITHQRALGNKIYLRVNSAVPEGETIRLAYTRPSSTAARIASEAGAYMSTRSAFAIENKTISKLPGRPSFVCAYRTYLDAAGTTIEWEDNFNAGSSIDRYEYRTRQSDSSLWSDWKIVQGNSARSTSFLSAAGLVQVRASNPNIRFAEIFGLSTGSAPFMRSVKFPLTIGIDLRQSDTLTGDVIEAIRASIVSKIAGYDLGSTIWANDIFAQVERVAGTEVKFDSTDTYVRYRGVDVNATNAHAVPLYAEWSVDPSDISIIFTN